MKVDFFIKVNNQKMTLTEAIKNKIVKVLDDKLYINPNKALFIDFPEGITLSNEGVIVFNENKDNSVLYSLKNIEEILRSSEDISLETIDFKATSNIPPTININSNVTINSDNTQTINYTATDIDGTVITTASVDESKGSVEVINNQVIFTPNPTFQGTATITLTTTDNDGATASDSIDLDIPNTAPIVETIPEGEILVNTRTYDDQREPAITSLKDGSFIITWTSFGDDGSYTGIVAQQFNSSGIKIGEEVQVNTHTLNTQNKPSITSFEDGSFIITWVSSQQDGSNTGIYAQKFDSNLEKVGDEFLVNTTTEGSQTKAKITTLSDGGFIITWESENQDGSDYGIFAQQFDENALKVGDEFLVNTTTNYEQSTPSITTLLDGSYIIA